MMISLLWVFILFPTRSFAFLSSPLSSLPSSLQRYSSCNTQHQHYQLHFLPISNQKQQQHFPLLLVPSSSHHRHHHRGSRRRESPPPLLRLPSVEAASGSRNNQLVHTNRNQQHHDPIMTLFGATKFNMKKASVGDEDFMVINNNENVDDDDEETYQIAIRNTILSIVVSIIFGAGLWVGIGSDVGKEFFAGYIVEKSLSVDNLFVFLLLFDYFEIPSGQYQNRILTWGIYGSIIMRSIMITLGAAALQHFKPVLLIFAAILIYSSFQVLIDVKDEIDIINNNEVDDEGGRNLDLESNPVIKLSRYICEVNEYCDIDEFDNAANGGNGGSGGSNNFQKPNPIVLFTRSLFPSTSELDGDKFFITTDDGIKKATPLFVCMIAIELSDVVFAVDSIPAVFGVTENPLVVFSSNMFAILGLRSLFPVLSKAVNELKYLESAVAVILAFIGGKMIFEYFDYTPISTETALAVIISLLAIGVIASMLDNNNNNNKKNEIEVL